MTHAITFDSLAYTKKLIAAGVPEKQAEVQAEALIEMIEDQLATKNDLKELEIALKMEIYKSKADTIKWVAGMLVAQAAIIAALIKLVVK